MARYRRGWNGLTQISPEPVFIPEVMELQVFDVPKRTKIKVEVNRKKNRRNIVLKAVTACAAVSLFVACAAIEGAFPAWAGILAAVSVGWLLLFTFANRRK